MGNDKAAIRELVQNTQSTIDIFDLFDRVNPNLKIEEGEFFGVENSESSKKGFVLFLEYGNYGTEIDTEEMGKILSNPVHRKKFFAITPKGSKIWENNKLKLEGGVLSTILPLLQKMDTKNATKVLEQIRDIQIRLNIVAKDNISKGELSQKEYEIYLNAFGEYLVSRAENLSDREFVKTLDKVKTKSAKAEDISNFFNDIFQMNSVRVNYERLTKELPPTRDEKLTFVYDKARDKFDFVTVDRESEYKKDGSIAVLGVVRAKFDEKGKFQKWGRFLLHKNAHKECRWLGEMGKARLQLSLEKAKKRIREREIKVKHNRYIPLVNVLEGMPIDDLIDDDLILSLIYTEHGWSEIIKAENSQKIDEIIFETNFRVALMDSKTFAQNTSNKDARGIGQIREGTHADIQGKIQGALPESFNKVVGNMDSSVYCMYLIAYRKVIQIIANLAEATKNGKNPKISQFDIYSYFYKGPHRFLSDPKIAIAIAYNNSSKRAAQYVLTGKVNNISENGRGYVASVNAVHDHLNGRVKEEEVAKK